MNTIRELVIDVMNRYYKPEDDCFGMYRYDETNEEYDMRDELKSVFKYNDIPYSIKDEDGFSSAGYSNDFLAVSWLDGDKIDMETVVLEYK